MAPPKDPQENTGGALPINQIYAACVAAGFAPGQEATIMTAICMAESGGRPLAVGRAVPNRPDYGIAQINYIHKDDGGAIPADFFPPGQKWKIPVTNLQAAKQIKSARGSFLDWVVYQTGAYSKFLPDAQKAAQSGEAYKLPSGQAQSELDKNKALFGAGVQGALGVLGLNPGGAVVGDTTLNIDENGNVTGDIGGVVGGVTNGLFDGLAKPLWMGGGAILVILGFIMMANSALPTGKIASAIGKVAS